MEKKNNKGKKRRDLCVSEIRRFSSSVLGDIRDFTGLMVLRPKDPNARPMTKVYLGAVEVVMKDVLRATGLAGELTRVQVPEEQIVCKGNVFTNAVDIRTLHLPSFFKFMEDLQRQARREDEQWLEKEKKKQRSRRKRWRSRQKTKRHAQASTEQHVVSPKDDHGETVQESNPQARPRA